MSSSFIRLLILFLCRCAVIRSMPVVAQRRSSPKGAAQTCFYVLRYTTLRVFVNLFEKSIILLIANNFRQFLGIIIVQLAHFVRFIVGRIDVLISYLLTNVTFQCNIQMNKNTSQLYWSVTVWA